MVYLLFGPPARLYLFEKYSSEAVNVTFSVPVLPSFCLTLSLSVQDVFATPRNWIIIAEKINPQVITICIMAG